MMGRIWAIALNTYREAIRQKILYGLLLFTASLIVFSLFLGQLTLGADTKIIKDMGLASIMLLGALMAIFMGVGLVSKEIERRTIFTILSKPIARSEFILGKFVGLSLTIGMEVCCMTILLFAVLYLYRDPLDFQLLKAIILIYMELCVLVAASLVFSSYSSSFMSTLFCFSFLLIGHVTDDFAQIMNSKLAYFLYEAPSGERWIGYGLSMVVRILEVFNLDHFAINAKIVHGVSVSWSWIANALFYGVCWIVVLLSGAVLLFRNKDFQ